MIELGELDKRQREFAERKVSVLCISIEDQESASEIERRFSSLTVLSDVPGEFSKGLDLILANGSPYGTPAMAPTTVLVDATGIVRWIYRPPDVINRLPPDELLARIDEFL